MNEREAALERELTASRIEIQLLRERVDHLIRMLYGNKSEQLDPKQLMLLEEQTLKKADAPVAEEAEAGAKKKSVVRSKPSGPRIPEHLPVDEEILDPDEVKACPQNWRLIGEEVSEQLDYQPGRFRKRRLIRRKYVHREHPYSAPVIAPLPARLQERCLATPELIAHVVVSKYVDHLPLYRQEQIYTRRYAVPIPRQTLCRWTELAAGWLEAVYTQMIVQQQSCSYLQMDETPIHYLDPGRGKTAQGYFWVSSQPGGDVIYHWYPSRSAECIGKILSPGFKGTVQSDGYQAYRSFQKQRAGPIQLAGCWAHARRKFYQARDRDPAIINWILRQIAQLYQIESRLRLRKAGAALRTALRASQSAPILRRLKQAFFILKPRYLPQSDMGKAINYALSQWQHLETFLYHGRVEIDNNRIENAIRPSALGKKNWLFLGSETSGKTSAILYSLIESAKRHGLEPYAYLCHLLRELPKATNRQIPQFTPAAIARNQHCSAA